MLLIYKENSCFLKSRERNKKVFEGELCMSAFVEQTSLPLFFGVAFLSGKLNL